MYYNINVFLKGMEVGSWQPATVNTLSTRKCTTIKTQNHFLLLLVGHAHTHGGTTPLYQGGWCTRSVRGGPSECTSWGFLKKMGFVTRRAKVVDTLSRFRTTHLGIVTLYISLSRRSSGQ